MQFSFCILYFVCFFSLNSASSRPVRTSQVFRFANIYGDHMVLQQSPFRSNVWGFGELGQAVVLVIGNIAYQSKVVEGPEGAAWMVNLDAHKGGPYAISATSKVNGTTVNITLHDVLFGDVWICSGQSNMQFSVSQVINVSEAVKEAANYPNIRLFTAFQVQSDTPLYELNATEQSWSVASSASINGGPWKYFSAVCWFYAKNLYDKYNYPLGMIATDWGGTAVEVWSSPDALKTCNITGEDTQPKKILPGEEVFVPTPSKHSVLYNAMIHPFLKMNIFGAIWYQGEANAESPNTYNCTFPAMIDDWRLKWYSSTGSHTDPQFPFGFVQLSSYGDDPTVIGGFPVIRWAQTANYGYVPNERMANVFMAVSMDLGNTSSPWGSIHPNDKQDVGYRLALAGRAVAYSESGVYYTGPLAVQILVSFKPMPKAWAFDVLYGDVGEQGIEIRSRDGFEFVCESVGVSSDWIKAQVLSNSFNKVSLFGLCPSEFDRLTGVRYAWRQNPCQFKACAVYSKAEGLPSPPFIKYGPF